MSDIFPSGYRDKVERYTRFLLMKGTGEESPEQHARLMATAHEAGNQLSKQFNVIERSGPESPGGPPYVYTIHDRLDLPTKLVFRTAKDSAGITIEDLLEVIVDRLEKFQAGKFPSGDNAVALAGVRSALTALYSRQIRFIVSDTEAEATKADPNYQKLEYELIQSEEKEKKPQ